MAANTHTILIAGGSGLVGHAAIKFAIAAGHFVRRTVDSYWRYHPVRADKLARALAALSGAPEGWVWRGGIQKSGVPVSFRAPPTPFREPAYSKGPGHCCVCGQPIFRFGWHRDLWGGGRQNQNATWHSCCVAWNLWIAPSDHVRHLKVLQKRRCLATGERLLKNAEVDHRVPLFKVWRDYRDTPWPALLAFWGPEPASHQSIRSRGEVRPRGGRAQGPSYPGNS